MAEEGEKEDWTVGEDDVKITDDLEDRLQRSGGCTPDGTGSRESGQRGGGASRDTSLWSLL